MRHLTRRLDRLEARLSLSARHAAVVRVTPTDDDIRQGKDLYQVALEQGLLPPDVLAGRRMVMLLPEKVTNMDVWLAQGRALEEWNANRPRCGEHLLAFVGDSCPQCTHMARVAQRGLSPGAGLETGRRGGERPELAARLATLEGQAAPKNP